MVPILVILVGLSAFGRANPIPNLMDDWTEAQMLANGYSPRQCQPIPENMTLCQSVGYKDMVLPNYFHQESVQEAVQQSNAWLPLLKGQCHPELKRFLCSLYAPVCLKGHQELKIVPCRALCTSVQEACLPILQRFGFAWPNNLHCEKFPVNDGLCIAPTSGAASNTVTLAKLPQPAPTTLPPTSGTLPSENHLFLWDSSQQTQIGSGSGGRHVQHDVGTRECAVCNAGPVTTEAVLSRFCQADFLLKGKIRRATASSADGVTLLQMARKVKHFKPSSSSGGRAGQLQLESCNCPWFDSVSSKGPYLIAGRIRSSSDGRSLVYEVSYMQAWDKSNRKLKQAMRRIRRQGEALCKTASDAAPAYNRRQSQSLLDPADASLSLFRSRRTAEQGNGSESAQEVDEDKKKARRRRARQRRKERCRQDRSKPGCQRRKRPSHKRNNRKNKKKKANPVEQKGY